MFALHRVVPILLIATASTAFAAGPGVLTKPPAQLERVEPEYPEAARAEGRTAEVLLAIDISDKGEVLRAEVLQSAGEAFDASALAAARKLRFSPAEIDGVPAAVQIEYRFAFEMRPAPAAAPEAPAAPVVNLRGRLLERGTRRPIAGATVAVGDLGATSDGQGRFEIADVPAGPQRVVVAAVDFARYETSETVEPGKRTEVTYYLLRTGNGGFETVVVGQKERKDVATVALSVGEIRKLPGTSGDTLKVVQSLPGTARAPAGLGMLIVRGGAPNDTRVYIDGGNVPMVFHFGGLTSIYASELVQDVEYEPGNFGVRYGRATAGRVELKTRDPNSERLHVVARADFIDALAFVEGPLSENVSGAFAVRRSYVDGLLKLAYDAGPDDPSFSIAPRYYDYQAKLVWKLGRNDTLRFDLFGTDDQLKLVGFDSGSVDAINSASMHTGFVHGSSSWEHRFSERTRLDLKLSGLYGLSKMSLGRILDDENWWSSDLRADLTHEVAPSLKLSAGADIHAVPRSHVTVVAPQIPRAGQIPNPDQEAYTRFNEKLSVLEPAAWVEATWHPIESVTVVPGLRVDHNSFIDATWVDPRLTARWALSDATALKGGVGLFHEPPFTVYATEQWGNPDLGPQSSIQYSAGVEQRIAGPVTLDLQLYYKRLRDLVQQSNATVVRDGQVVPEKFNNDGSGKAYGAEVLLRYKPDARFFGWIAYTYARSKLDQTVLGYRFDGTGADYDQPHNFIAVGSLALPEIWNGLSVGLKLRFSSGNPYRPTTAGVYDVDGDQWQGIPGMQTRRLPNFFQADLRVDKQWTFDTWAFTAYLDVQNVTNRGNVEGVGYAHDFTASGYSTGLPILPSFGLRAEY